eukprot:3941760-Rhodomonas_salina.2
MKEKRTNLHWLCGTGGEHARGTRSHQFLLFASGLFQWLHFRSAMPAALHFRRTRCYLCRVRGFNV